MITVQSTGSFPFSRVPASARSDMDAVAKFKVVFDGNVDFNGYVTALKRSPDYENLKARFYKHQELAEDTFHESALILTRILYTMHVIDWAIDHEASPSRANPLREVCVKAIEQVTHGLGMLHPWVQKF
jgi:hypothetical protein